MGRRDTHGPGGAARATQANVCHKSPLGTCQWAGHQGQGGDTQRGVQCRTVQVAAHRRGAGEHTAWTGEVDVEDKEEVLQTEK